MVIENNNNNQEQKEIVKQENINENNTIEDVLQEKFKDPIKESFFLNIFRDPNIKSTYSEDVIIKFILGNKEINKFYRTNQETELNEKVKIISEELDIFEKNNGNTTIINVSNILEDDVGKKEDDVGKKEDDVGKKEDDVGKKEVINLNIQHINEQAKATKESYDNLADTYKTSEQQIQDFKTNKENNTLIEQINNSTQGTELSTDDYLKFYLTANTHQDKLQGTEFMTNYEELSKMIEIPPLQTTLRNTITNKDHVDAITATNPSLKNYSTNSSKLNTLTTPDLPKTKNTKQEFKLYVKLIADEKLRNSIENNKKLILKYDPKKENKEEIIKAYTEYQKAITQVQEQLPERTKTISKQRVLGNCITGLARYFDTTTLNQENFADNFDINTQTGFSIGKGQSKYDEGTDDILSIQGKINGNNIGFHYNLDNPESQLKADDHLHMDITSNLFSLGVENGGQKQLGVKLPTIGLLTEQTQSVINKHFSNILETSENMEEIEAELKQKISDELLKNYGQEALVKTRVARDIEKNITTQTLQKTFIPSPVLAELNSGENRNINNTTETRAWNILEIREKTTENMRSDELRKFRTLTQRFNNEVQQKNNPNLEKEWTELIQEIQSEQETVSYDQRGNSIEKFFKTITGNNKKINLDDFEQVVDVLEKNEGIEKNMNKFSPNFQTQRTKETADNDLHLEDTELRGNST